MRMTWSPLFICGCPRSGTSALQMILASDKRIKIGMERYYYKASNNFSLTRELFDEERFFKLQKGDTFWTDSKMLSYLRSNFKESVYRGDKIPKLYCWINELFDTMPDAKLIFIVRNIIEVASSYNKRAYNTSDHNWTNSKNYIQAVSDWNESLIAITSAKQAHYKVHVIEFESFFSEKIYLNILYEFLNLNLTDEVSTKFNMMINKSKNLTANRTDCLSPLEKKYILLNANISLYKNIAC